MSRIGLGRHGQIEEKAGDPLDGLVNLFDIGMILAVAFLDFFNLIQIPEYFAGFITLTYIVAGWVLAYHVLEAMKKRG